ncbi:MAG TPA: hypothetical protein VGC53_13785 [Vicinamibacteria bacterium]
MTTLPAPPPPEQANPLAREGCGSTSEVQAPTTHYPITTSSERAPQYFDQGLWLAYAFLW